MNRFSHCGRRARIVSIWDCLWAWVLLISPLSPGALAESGGVSITPSRVEFVLSQSTSSRPSQCVRVRNATKEAFDILTTGTCEASAVPVFSKRIPPGGERRIRVTLTDPYITACTLRIPVFIVRLDGKVARAEDLEVEVRVSGPGWPKKDDKFEIFAASIRAGMPEAPRPSLSRGGGKGDLRMTTTTLPAMANGDPGVFSGSMKYWNSGVGPLHIRSVLSSCNCNQTTVTLRTLQPGESGILSFKSKRVEMKGRFRSWVAIVSDDPLRPILPIKVVGPPETAISPRLAVKQEAGVGLSVNESP